LKESRGGASRSKRQAKSKKQQRRHRFSSKGGPRHLLAQQIKHDWQELKQERVLELQHHSSSAQEIMPSFMESLDDSSLMTPSSSTNSHYAYSLPRERCDVEGNIAPLCNKACCRPPIIIPGLQQLLLLDGMEQQQQLPALEQSPQPPSYQDIATTPPVQEQYVFEDLQIVPKGPTIYRREYDEYSEELSFDSQGIARYKTTSQTAFRRFSRGCCETCSYGNGSSYGFNANYQDYELMVLPSLEFAVSSRLFYKPFRMQLQHLITTVYDWKDEMYDLDGSDTQECEMLEDLYWKCKWTTQRIVRLLKAYVSNEEHAQSELSFLSLAVYKSHLQQVAIEHDWGKEHLDGFLAGTSDGLYEHADWKSLRASIPHNRLSSIGIIVQHVKPYLLDIREY
jgi:hypothetical protein